jgi:hypothetical protein
MGRPLASLFAAAALLVSAPSALAAGTARADPDEMGSDPPPDPPDGEDPADELERPPRPPLAPPIELPEPPAWKRHIELGGDAAYVIRPFANGLEDSAIAYQPAIGFGVHLHWDLLEFLQLRIYFLDAHHDLTIPQGALATGSSNSISASASLSDMTVESIAFGVRLAPTLQLGRHARGWISAGIGWGRFTFPSMTVQEKTGMEFLVRGRAGSFAEFPFGLGVSYEVWPRWLALEYEATAAPVVGQSGDAFEPFQAIDDSGNARDVGPFGAIEASFVQTLGLSLIL